MALEIGDSVKVRGYGGIAFRFDGHPTVFAESEWILDCDKPEEWESDHREHTEACGYWSEDEDGSEDTAVYLCHMVGDDRTFRFDVDDLTPLPRDAYCGECGQIGCSHDGYDRSEA